MTEIQCILCRNAITAIEDSDNFSKCSNTPFRSILENVLDYYLPILNSELRFCENCVDLLNELDLADYTYKSIKQKIINFCIGFEVQAKRSDACCQTNEVEFLKNEFYEIEENMDEITDDVESLKNEFHEIKQSMDEIADNIEFEFIDNDKVSKCYICCVNCSTEEEMIEHSKMVHHITIKKAQTQCIKNSPNNLNGMKKTACLSKKISNNNMRIGQVSVKRIIGDCKLAGRNGKFKNSAKFTKPRVTQKPIDTKKIVKRKKRNTFSYPIIISNSIIDNNFLKSKERQVKTKKPSENSTGYKCETCLKNWRTKEKLKSHSCGQTSEQIFICELCGQICKNRSHLNGHLSTHTGVYAYPCSVCSKPFAQKAMLERHVRIHTGEIQYQCDLCGKSFIHNSSFRTHMLLHAGRKDFKCALCGFALFSRTHLQRHMRVHTKEKPYQCSMCCKTFAEKYNLYTHLKVHAKFNEIPNQLE